MESILSSEISNHNCIDEAIQSDWYEAYPITTAPPPSLASTCDISENEAMESSQEPTTSGEYYYYTSKIQAIDRDLRELTKRLDKHIHRYSAKIQATVEGYSEEINSKMNNNIAQLQNLKKQMNDVVSRIMVFSVTTDILASENKSEGSSVNKSLC